MSNIFNLGNAALLRSINWVICTQLGSVYCVGIGAKWDRFSHWENICMILEGGWTIWNREAEIKGWNGMRTTVNIIGTSETLLIDSFHKSKNFTQNANRVIEKKIDWSKECGLEHIQINSSLETFVSVMYG